MKDLLVLSWEKEILWLIKVVKVSYRVFSFLFAGIMCSNIISFIPTLEFDGNDYEYCSIKI